MKAFYVIPEMEIVEFPAMDLITTSSGDIAEEFPHDEKGSGSIVDWSELFPQ